MSGPASVRRQKLLRRALPALAVLVGYFSFIGPRVSESSAKAQQEIQRMKDEYMAGQSKLNELARQKKELMGELTALRQSVGKSSPETTRQTGFLGQPDYTSQAIGRLGQALTRNRLRVIEEGRQDWGAAKDSIPKSVQDLSDPAKTAKSKSGEPGGSLWRVRFGGAYPDVYRALEELSRDGVAVVPVSLDMAVPEGGGDIEWTIRVWI